MDVFVGSGAPLSKDGVNKTGGELGCSEAILWALLAVETAGCGYQKDRRPKILFERHIFHRLTEGRFDADDPDISAPTAGGYGAGGSHQYARLQAAMQVDEEAALSSASWGLGQILGINYQKAGFGSVREMVDAFVNDEDAQLAGMASFIRQSGLAGAIQQKRWKDYARVYNGANYAKNRYDEKLQLSCANYETHGCPDVDLRGAQVYLNYLGFDTGGIDGIKGSLTAAALKTFQKTSSLPVSGMVDESTLLSLRSSVAAS